MVYDSAQAFVDAQKTDPLTYGTTHLGGIDDVSAFMFARRGDLATPKIIPFEGGGELATQLVAGAVDVAVLNLAEAGSQIAAGDICPIVVLAPERMRRLADVSTAQELGIDANFSTVRGFVVHADTPDDVAAKIEESLMKAMNHNVYQGFLTSVGLDSTSVAGSEVWGQPVDLYADGHGRGPSRARLHSISRSHRPVRSYQSGPDSSLKTKVNFDGAFCGSMRHDSLLPASLLAEHAI